MVRVVVCLLLNNVLLWGTPYCRGQRAPSTAGASERLLSYEHSLPNLWKITWFIICLCSASVSIAQEDFVQLNQERLQVAKRLEQRAIATHNRLLLGHSKNLLGDIYNLGGSNSVSKRYYLEALRILEPLGDSHELGKTYLKLSIGLAIYGNSRQDLDYIYRAITLFHRMRSPADLAQAYNHLTSAYKRRWVWPGDGLEHFKRDKAQFDTVTFCIKQIEGFGRQADDTLMLGEANLQLGDLYRHLHDQRAIPYVKKSIHLFAQQKNDTLLTHAWVHLASAYMEFGQLRLTKEALDQAQKIVDETKTKEFWVNTHLIEGKMEYYKKTDQWKDAFLNQVKWVSIQQYRMAGENDGTITRLKLESEAGMKEMQLKNQQWEIDLYTQNIKSQQRFIIIILLLLIATASISFLFFRLYRKNQRISHQNEELVREQNHRVKNNLQVISSLLSLQSRRLTDGAARQAVEESQMRVQAVALLHRRLYDGDKLAQVKLDEFIPELIQAIMKTFGVVDVHLQLTIDPISLPADQAVPLGLILNELTTNACKYAFPTQNHPFFHVNCYLNQHRLYLRVQDNGVRQTETGQSNAIAAAAIWERNVIDPPVKQRKTLGMSLIESQVEQLNGVSQFIIDGGTLFTLEFRV